MSEGNTEKTFAEQAPEAVVQTKRSFSIIWVVPIIALLIGGWLTFKAMTEKGPEITITFETAEGLEAGAHRLSVRLPGAATLFSEVITIAPGEQASLPAAVPDRGLAISGRVLSGATYQPLAGARVTCEPGSPNQFRKPQRLARLQTAVSDADGVFLLEGLDPGRCRAVVKAPGFAAWRLDDVQPDEVGADLGDIELDHGMTVVGRVLDRSNRPQAGISVEITEDAAYAYFAETTVRTDHDGWFVGAVAVLCLLGTVAGLSLMYGVSMLMLRRWRAEARTVRRSFTSDWTFLWLLWLAGLTGFVIELALYLPTPPVWGYLGFLIHVAIAMELVLLVPFTKFAHVIYRPVSLFLGSLAAQRKAT